MERLVDIATDVVQGQQTLEDIVFADIIGTTIATDMVF